MPLYDFFWRIEFVLKLKIFCPSGHSHFGPQARKRIFPFDYFVELLGQKSYKL